MLEMHEQSSDELTQRVNAMLEAPNADQMEWLKGKNEQRLNDTGYPEAHRKLMDRLMSFGGHEVVIQFEEDFKRLMQRGILIMDNEARLQSGARSQCHMNSAYLWEADKENVRLITGWALSKDGLWRQHSWCIDFTDAGQVVETTEHRVAYYGFIMEDEEAEQFLFDNM